MDEQNLRDAAIAVASERPLARGPGLEELWCQLAGFTRAEYRRLLFLRWLYQTGRLTEACA